MYKKSDRYSVAEAKRRGMNNELPLKSTTHQPKG